MREFKGPVAAVNEKVSPVVSRFQFERPTRVAGRSNTDDSLFEEFTDPDIHDGTVVTAHGYARVALHKPTGTVCLIASKASANLQGEMQSDGSIIAVQDGLEKSYIVGAYQTNGTDDDIKRVAPKLRRALRRYGEDLGERSEKHFTLYGASFDRPSVKGVFRGLGDKTRKIIGEEKPPPEMEEIEIFTNGRLAYHIKQDNGRYHVMFHAPVRRKDGSFVPVQLRKGGLANGFASVSKTIATADNYADAHHKLMAHWQSMSSKLWDEKNILQGEGVAFRARHTLANIFNHVVDHGVRLTAVTLSVGAITAAIEHKYTLAAGILAAVTHTTLDMIVDEGYGGAHNSIKKVRDARRKLDIRAYDYDSNAADHFKIQTAENMRKTCPKMDFERFKAGDFEFLSARRSGMLLDHEQPFDGFRPSSLRAHLLSVHQRGFSSSCILPDPHTRVDAFQSGLVRLLHEREDGKVVIYARYRDGANLQESLKMPEEQRERMDDHIWRFEYDRQRDNFHLGFRRTVKPISLDEMMDDLEHNLLFRDQKGIDPSVKKRSLGAVRSIFRLPGEGKTPASASNPDLYMDGRPTHPPYLKALGAAGQRPM